MRKSEDTKDEFVVHEDEYKEVIKVFRWVAIVIGLAGVVIILKPGTELFTIYSLNNKTMSSIKSEYLKLLTI